MLMFGVTLSNTSVYYYQLDGRTADDLHGHDAVHQVSLPLLGAPSVLLDTERHTLTDDLRAVTSPGHRHQNFAGQTPVRLLIINLERELVDHVYREYTGHDAPVMETEQWEHDLTRLLLTLQEGTHGERWRARRLAPDHPALRRAMARIHDGYQQELSLDDLAAAAGVNKSHLIRLFREQLATTPAQYLTDLRVEQVTQMLRTTGLPVTDLAFAAGFGSLSAFERAFKRKHGVSAGAYRRSFTGRER